MDWNTAVAEYLGILTAGTRRQYELSLKAFAIWYEQQYHAVPDPALLTKEELRDWQKALLEKRTKTTKKGRSTRLPPSISALPQSKACPDIADGCWRSKESSGWKNRSSP